MYYSLFDISGISGVYPSHHSIQWFSADHFIMTNAHSFPFAAGFLLFLLAALLDEFSVEVCKIYLMLWPLILFSHSFPSANQDHQPGGLRDAAFTILWWGVLVQYWIGSRRLIWWVLTSLATEDPVGAGIVWVVLVFACFDFWGLLGRM
jgi:hypothetical protein